jgi:hypothetical protein
MALTIMRHVKKPLFAEGEQKKRDSRVAMSLFLCSPMHKAAMRSCMTAK